MRKVFYNETGTKLEFLAAYKSKRQLSYSLHGDPFSTTLLAIQFLPAMVCPLLNQLNWCGIRFSVSRQLIGSGICKNWKPVLTKTASAAKALSFNFALDGAHPGVG